MQVPPRTSPANRAPHTRHSPPPAKRRAPPGPQRDTCPPQPGSAHASAPSTCSCTHPPHPPEHTHAHNSASPLTDARLHTPLRSPRVRALHIHTLLALLAASPASHSHSTQRTLTNTLHMHCMQKHTTVHRFMHLVYGHHRVIHRK
jgi:hypothetical protein